MTQIAILKIAPPYKGETVAELEAGFSEMLGKKIHFKAQEAPDLIGGFIAYVDGRVYDSSFATKLSSLSNYMKDEEAQG